MTTEHRARTNFRDSEKPFSDTKVEDNKVARVLRWKGG